jgi:hypothetical protein
MAKIYAFLLSLFVISGGLSGRISLSLQKAMGYNRNCQVLFQMRLRLRGGCAGTSMPLKDKELTKDVFIDAVHGSDDQVESAHPKDIDEILKHVSFHAMYLLCANITSIEHPEIIPF